MSSENLVDWQNWFASPHTPFFGEWWLDASQKYTDLLYIMAALGRTCKALRLRFETAIKQHLVYGLAYHIYVIQYTAMYGIHGMDTKRPRDVDPNGFIIDLGSYPDTLAGIKDRGNFWLGIRRCNAQPQGVIFDNPERWNMQCECGSKFHSFYLDKMLLMSKELVTTRIDDVCVVEIVRHNIWHITNHCFFNNTNVGEGTDIQPTAKWIESSVCKRISRHLTPEAKTLNHVLRDIGIRTPEDCTWGRSTAKKDVFGFSRLVHPYVFHLYIENMVRIYRNYALQGFPIEEILSHGHPQNMFNRFFGALYGCRRKYAFDADVVARALSPEYGRESIYKSYSHYLNTYGIVPSDIGFPAILKYKKNFYHVDAVSSNIAEPLYNIMRTEIRKVNGKSVYPCLYFDEGDLHGHNLYIRTTDNPNIINIDGCSALVRSSRTYNDVIVVEWHLTWYYSSLESIERIIDLPQKDGGIRISYGDSPLCIPSVNDIERRLEQCSNNLGVIVQLLARCTTTRTFVISIMILLQRPDVYEIIGRMCTRCLCCGRLLRYAESAKNCFGPTCFENLFERSSKSYSPGDAALDSNHPDRDYGTKNNDNDEFDDSDDLIFCGTKRKAPPK